MAYSIIQRHSQQQTPAVRGPCTKDMVRGTLQQSGAAKAQQILCLTLIAVTAMLILTPTPLLAAAANNTVWTKFSDVMKDIYSKLLGISTILAVTAATVALLVRMISRNQRAVDEASSWLKRITVTWIILNTLGFIIAYLQPWFQGGQYTP